MEAPKQSIDFEITDTPLNDGFSLMNTNNYEYFVIALVLVIGFGIYKWFNIINMEKILDDIERQIMEWKNNITFYKNQLLLRLNMEGNAIKARQPTSYSSLSKYEF